MPDPIACLLAVLAAAGATAASVLAFGWLGRRTGDAACVVGIAAGLVVGYAVLRFEPSWPPASALDRWLLIVIPAALCIELIAALRKTPPWLAAALRIALAVAAGRVMLHGSIYLKGETSAALWQAVATLAVAPVLLVAVWGLLLWLARRDTGPAVPLAIAESLICGGLAIMLAGYVGGGEATLPPASAVAVATLTSSAKGVREASRGAIGLGIVALFGLLFIGRFFGALPTWQALVIFLAPLLCWVGELHLFAAQRAWLAVVVRLSLVAIPLLVVLAAAKYNFDRTMAPLLSHVPTCIDRFAGL